MLAVSLLGLCTVVPPMAIGVIGIVEGIMYLTKSDTEFHEIYVVGQQGWF